VTIGSSANLAYQLKLPVHDALVELAGGKERKLPGEKFYIPGSVLQVSLDSASQPAWGMGGTADVYFDASPVFNIDPAAYANGTSARSPGSPTTNPFAAAGPGARPICVTA
jgi:hypothetical protein